VRAKVPNRCKDDKADEHHWSEGNKAQVNCCTTMGKQDMTQKNYVGFSVQRDGTMGAVESLSNHIEATNFTST